MRAGKRLMMAVFLLAMALAYPVLAADPNSPTRIATDVFPNVVNVEEEALFTVQYENDPSTNVSLYICREATCSDCGNLPDKSGCWCYNETPAATGMTACVYTADEEDAYPAGYFVKMVNVTSASHWTSDFNPGDDSASFDINLRPVPFNVYISSSNPRLPEGPTNLSMLYCNYTYSDPEDDTQRTELTRFRWMIQDNGAGAFQTVTGAVSNTLANHHFQKSDVVKCTVNVTDTHYLSSYPGVNSTIITINNSGPTFLSTPGVTNNLDNATLGWTASFTDTDGDAVNVSLVRWYRNNVPMPAYDNLNVTSDATSIGEAWKAELHLSDVLGAEGESMNSSSVTIQSSGPLIVSVNTTSDFENATIVGHNVTFSVDWNHTQAGETAAAFFCNATGATETGCPAGARAYCQTTQTTADPAICRYTVLPSDPILNTYYVVVCDSYDACSPERSGTFARYNDSMMPNITASFLRTNISGRRNITFFFNITDNYNLSLSTLTLNITNTSNQTIHMPTSSRYFARTWDIGKNLTCSGTATNLSCSLNRLLAQGTYTITLLINDSNGNQFEDSTIFIVDTVVPDIQNVANGYIDDLDDVIMSDFAITGNLYVNWTNITGSLSGIDRYEYAIGTNENYNQSGWNSTRGWTDVGVHTEANYSSSLSPGTSYFFHVRAINRGGAISNVSTSSGVVYEDITPPVCHMVYDYGPHHPNWTNSLTALDAWWNFTDAETNIPAYEVAIGNATPTGNGNPPGIGFENVFPRTSMSNWNFSDSDLTLHANQTYYFSVRAKNADNAWSSWCYSDGVTVDNHDPYNASISYPESFVAYTNITIYMRSGTDDMSGIDDNTGVRLLVAKAPINQVDFTCPEFSSFYHSTLNPPYNPLGVLFNTTPGYCYKFRLQVQDRAGNEITVHSNQELMDDKTVVTDITAPLTFQVFDSGHKTYDGTRLSANWTFSSDQETGIDHYSYAIFAKSKVDGTHILAFDWVNVTFSTRSVIRTGLNLSDETQYFIYVRAVNRVGLETEAVSNGILYQDNTPPGPLNLTRLENGSTAFGYRMDRYPNSNTTLFIQGFDTDLARCIFTPTDTGYYEAADNSTRCAVAGAGIPKNITCNIPVATEGHKLYYVYCRDVNGNNQYNEQSPSIPLEAAWVNDWSGPTLTISSPLINSIVGGLVDIDVDPTDSGIGVISMVWYQVFNLTGSEIVNGTLSPPSYQEDWDAFVGDHEGTFTLIVHGNDTLGNYANTSVNFTINRGMPLVSIYNDLFVNSTITIRVLAQSFTNMSYTIFNQTNHTMHHNGSNSTSMRNYFSLLNTIDISDPDAWPDGIYRIYSQAIDNNSNTTNATVYFTIDRIPPAIFGLTNTYPLVLHTGDHINLSASFFDSIPLSSAVIWLNDSTGYTNYSWINGSQLNNLTYDNGTFTLQNYQVPQLSNNKTFTWYAEMKDAVGNRNISEVRNFSILNSAPVFGGSDIFIDMYEDQVHTEIILFEDQDGDALTITGTNGTSVKIVRINSTSLTITLNSTPDWYGSDTITLNASDPSGAWNLTSFIVNVSNVNDAPRLNSSALIPNATFPEDSSYTGINVSDHVYDIDSSSLAFGWEAPNAPGNLTIIFHPGGRANITVRDHYSGLFRINFTVTDGQYTTKGNQIFINVTPVNDPPVFGTIMPVSVNESNNATIVMDAADPDSAWLNYTVNDTRFVKQEDNVTFIWETDLSDAGTYGFNVTVIDEAGLNDSAVFTVIVLDAADMDGDGIPDFKDSDNDGDGVPDLLDSVFGNGSSISSNIPHLQVWVNMSSNLSRAYNGTLDVLIHNFTTMNITGLFVALEHDFDSGPLDLSLLDVHLENLSIQYGMVLSGGALYTDPKDIYLHPINYTLDTVCVKDNSSAGINVTDISSLCNASDEQLVVCDGEDYGGYTCNLTVLAGASAWKVTGLEHSVLLQMEGCTDRDGDGYGVGTLCSGTDFNDSNAGLHPGTSCYLDACHTGSVYNSAGVCSGGTNTCGGSSGGGGGGSSSGFIRLPEEETGCEERWVCTPWSECDISGAKTRLCNEANRCNTTLQKPLVYQACADWELVAPVENCTDGIINQGETGIDCGGSCEACPTCNDGMQNQGETGTDCGGPCGTCDKPEVQAPSTITIIKDNYTKFVIPGAGVILVLGILAAAFYWKAQDMKSREEAEFWVKEEAGNILYYKRFDQKIFNKLVQLRVYVRRQMLGGKTKEEIRKELLMLGWKEAMIEESFLLSKYVSLELYVRHRLIKGVSREEIKLELLRAGWPDKEVDGIFSLNTLVQVELYIRKRLRKGEKEEEVKKHLLKAGWSPKIVEILFGLNYLLDLEMYINQQISEGQSEKGIRTMLINAGWPHETVDEAITFCKLTR